MRSKKYCLLLGVALLLAGCSTDILRLGGDGDMEAGEAIEFTTYVPGKAATRTARSEFETHMASYQAVTDNYTFNIKMYQKDVVASIGTGVYKSVTEGDGTLTATTPLYWPDNVNRYGFEATAGSTTWAALAADQSTKEKLIGEDYLLGYAFMPLWTGNVDTGSATDHVDVNNNPNARNYRTNKEWKTANESLGLSDPSKYKKIPLYLQHQRSLITIKLKAGDGVERGNLTYANAKEHIETIVYSYNGDNTKEITPYAKQSEVDYAAGDPGGAATGVETTEYSCVVEPYNYLSVATEKPIARINLSGQHFTFYASNDYQYDEYEAVAEPEDHPENADVIHMNHYNLQRGQHLVITATLGRGSRKILITAYVEDWTETVTTSILDDYGKSGEPVQITSRDDLINFLKSDKNKAGTVAIVVPPQLNLEGDGDEHKGSWESYNDYELKATLNLAGATLHTEHQIFNKIGPMGNVINGSITVGNSSSPTEVPAAIAKTNLGNIERITVLPRDILGNNAVSKATQAGLVINNSGIISQCSSELPVYGTYDTTVGSKQNLVGGIAAYSVYSAENNNTMPVIDRCTVNARVDGEQNHGSNDAHDVQGAGIVGEAAGRVSNNTFVYGRTLLQDATSFKNTIHHKGGTAEQELRAYGNAWPTTANANGTGIPDSNTNNANTQYTGVIDSQRELAALLTSDIDGHNHNGESYSYRLSGDITVTKAESYSGAGDGWTYGKKGEVGNSSGSGNVYFKLDGNGHTITTETMLFSNIMNEISNLTIKLSADLIAEPEAGGIDVMAPLGYTVNGPDGKLSNIQIKCGSHRVQAATVGGVVVRAIKDAIIENCQSNAYLTVWIGNPGNDQKIFSGGIVAIAEHATITRCIFHGTSDVGTTKSTLYRNTAAEYTGLVNGSDTHTGLFYGGIVGGTMDIDGNGDAPSLLITDCTSWFSTSGSAQKGAIVGYAMYAVGTTTHNGIANGCQGNWWPTGAKGIGTWLPTTGEDAQQIESLLGKRNAVTPTQNASYDN